MDSLGDYLDKGLLLIIADLFSLITVSSCLVLKVPQINTIRANKSAEGISVLGLCLELYSYTVMMSYNYTNRYAFLSYMEYPILLIQEYFLVYFVFKYKNLLGKKTLTFALVYSVLAGLIYLHLIPVMVFAVLVPFCTPIGATSKVLQLFAILKSKDSSSVSLTTWALSAFTNFSSFNKARWSLKDGIILWIMSMLSTRTVRSEIGPSTCRKAVKKEHRMWLLFLWLRVVERILQMLEEQTRIYTVYVESYDLMLLSNFMLSFFISSSVYTAAWYYKPKSKKEKAN